MSKSGRTPSMSSNDAAILQGPSNFTSLSKVADATELTNTFPGGHRGVGGLDQSSMGDRRTPPTDKDASASSGTSIPSDIEPPSETENDEGWEDEYSDDGQADSSHGYANN